VNRTDKLRKFMAENHFSPSDIYMAMIPILNPEKGKGIIRRQERLSILGHPAKELPKLKPTVHLSRRDLEECTT